MMDINKEWQKLEKAKFSNSSIKKDEIMKAIQTESKSTISQLKQSLKIKLYWILFFMLGFAGFAIFNLNNTTLVGVMAVAFLCYGIAGVNIKKEYDQMGVTPDFSNSTLESLRFNYKLIKSALRKENVFGFVTFPILVIGAFLLRDSMDGVSIGESIANLWTLKKLAIATSGIAVGAIMAYYMNKAAFGSHLENLRKNIIDLEQVD